MKCRHQTARYHRGAPRVVHAMESPAREAATSSGVMHATLSRDFPTYLTAGQAETVMEVGQRIVDRGMVSLQCLTHRLRQTGRGPDLPVAARWGSSK
jgi:hypothetical protein